MKRSLPLTLPAVGSTYPFDIDGVTELRTIESLDLGRGLMFLAAKGHALRPTFINDVVRMVRPNDAAAWLPVLREHYSMDSEGRTALIAEANPRTVEEDLAWVDSLECDPYLNRDSMRVLPEFDGYHNGVDLARAFPRVSNDDLRHDLYATIGDPVPDLVWPRQESEQSPTRSETESPTEDMSRACLDVTKEPEAAPAVEVSPAKPHVYKTGDKVKVARRVERDSTGHWCFWTTEMDATIGRVGEVLASLNGGVGACLYVRVSGSEFYYSPEALVDEALVAVQTEGRTFKRGDKIRIARKVEVDSKGRDCGWSEDHMTPLLGTEAVVYEIVYARSDDEIPIRAGTSDTYTDTKWYSPEALDLIEAAPE